MTRGRPEKNGDVALPAAPPDPRKIDRSAPLRLAVADELAFPFGGMTASGLGQEAARGNLVIERIAGKDFVTLAAIEAMREKCRTTAREPAGDSDQPQLPARRPGSSETAPSNAPRDAALMILEKLSGGSPIASPKRVGRRGKLV